MQTPEFEGAVELLLTWIKVEPIALMCAEAVPWRCHRSMIADALTVRGVRVEEIVSPTKLQVHQLTRFAKVSGLTITYPAYEDPAASEGAGPGGLPEDPAEKTLPKTVRAKTKSAKSPRGG